MAKMTDKEITQFIEFYIGVDRYRGLRGIRDISNLREFYYVDCDLDIEPSLDLATADEFERILRSQSPQYQARILRAGLQEFFVYSDCDPDTRQEKLRPRLEVVATRLESESNVIENVTPQSPSESVRLSLEDAEDLIRRGRVPSAVDRTHTALHAYMKDLCNGWHIAFEKDASLTKLFKLLRKEHPAFYALGPRHQDIDKTLNGLATALDALNTIRNQASLSHPPIKLLAEPEATLAINAARSIFHYAETVTQELFDEMNSYQSAGTSPPNSSPFDDASTNRIDDIPF